MPTSEINQKSLQETETRLQDLEAQKTLLLQQVQDVEAQIELARSRRAVLVNEAAPVSQLPPELLSHIFMLICQEDTTPRSKSFQVVASHVCAVWRSVALGTPLLWSNIELLLNCSPKSVGLGVEEEELEFSRFASYLTRSKGCLLDVRIEVNGNFSMNRILELLAADIRRYRSLSVTITNHPNPVSSLLSHLGSSSAPNLEYLSVQIPYCRLFDYNSVQYRDTEPSILKDGTPQLRSLRLTGIAGPLQPPLGNVTTFHLDGTHMDHITLLQFRHLLQSSPSLTNLSMNEVWVQTDRSRPVDPILVPHLRSLRVRSPQDYNLHSLLSYLPFWQLESIVISAIESFRPMVFSNAKTVTLDGCSITPEEVGNFILAFPVMEHLTISWGTPSTIFIALGYPASPTWWPKLRVLSVKEMQVRDVAVFMDMIRSRQQAMQSQQGGEEGGRLEKLVLDKRSRSVLRLKGLLEELCGLLKVESGDEEEEWPVGLGYNDENDGFWY